MSLPKISINFQEAASSFIERSKKGTLLCLVKDNGVESGLYELYSEKDIDEKLTEANRGMIERGFIGAAGRPKKVLCLVISEEEGSLSAALGEIENVRFDYAAPAHNMSAAEMEEFCEWIKKERAEGHFVKAVLPGVEADCEGIVNFGNTYILAEREFEAAEFTSRVAGFICATPITQSTTYGVLSDVKDVDSFKRAELEAAVNSGKFILFNDGEKVKVLSGVTSLVSEEGVISAFKKIKIVEAADMIRTDIRKTAEDRYIGKMVNSYDNKCVLICAIAEYFAGLEREGILKSGSEIGIDVEAQREYLESRGTNTYEMSEQEIKEADTGEFVFLKAQVAILDAIEDITLNIGL